MGASQSDLSDPHFGFDLVVAVTQASINVTLTQLLADLTAPEVTVCYVYDDSNNLVPIDYHTLVSNAHGSDPFQVPNGANPATNSDLVNLMAANFAGGVRAMLGLPGVPAASLPPIVTLGAGTSAPVLFNLLCAEFQVTGFQYGPRNSATWVNLSQPTTGSPWYFSANIQLNSATVDPNGPVPAAVRQRITDLRKEVENAFSIQKLFLDLDTAILESAPTIQGLTPGWAVWNLITADFLGAYFTELGQKGDPVLSYSFTLDAPRPTTLQLGSLSRECAPLMDTNDKPISNPTAAEQAATALVYIGSQSTTPPVPVPFPWNWMELNDVTAFSGVQSVRRDVFLTYFNALVNTDVGPLCLDTSVTYTHSGETFYWDYESDPSASPQRFNPIIPIGASGSDGFTEVSSLAFKHDAYSFDHSATDAVSVWGDFNYALNGTVAVKGNQIRIMVQATVYMSFHHREVFVQYTDLEGAYYYNKTLTVLYTLGVDQNGALQVVPSSSVADNSAPWHFTPKGILGGTGAEAALQGALTSIEQDLAGRIDSAFTGFADEMTAVINGYRAWVFAGNDAFTFRGVGFSKGLDLIAQLGYVDPS
jgi:hypothetical protein